MTNFGEQRSTDPKPVPQNNMIGNQLMAPRDHPFPADTLKESGYRVFSEELENDPNVFFHATKAKNLKPIMSIGLQPGIKFGGALKTISYATNSADALTHWHYTHVEGDEWIILALRFKTLDELEKDGMDYRSPALKQQPVIEFKTTIPRWYQHL